jgi:Methylase involved in ubiquinone/menaquinone biosynthesis
MNKYVYQHNFSEGRPLLYDLNNREQKAKKIISILSDYYNNHLKNLVLLDIGSSTGIMTRYLSKYFKKTTGIDIDENAVSFAQENFKDTNLTFCIGDSMNIPFPNDFFDVINCTQIYEHVPNSKKLMEEIYRALKPGGTCFFAAGNRFVLIEGHYKLPLLSAIPKKIAHIYLRILRRGNYYYENHLSYWGLKKLTSQFEVIDYTKEVIKNPEKYNATDMLTSNSFKQKLVLFILKLAYWLCPDYIWLLKKSINEK